MAQSISQIQTSVRNISRLGDIDLTEAANLARVNRFYRIIAGIDKWPEFRRRDTSITTVAGTAAYTFPVGSGVYRDVTVVELQDWDNDNKFKPVPPATDESEMSAAGTEVDDFPRMYNRLNDGSNNVIEFLPAPSMAATLRITGYIEPTALTSGGTTIFQLQDLDDALIHLVSADLAIFKNNLPHAKTLADIGAQIIGRAAGREVTVQELGLFVEGE